MGERLAYLRVGEKNRLQKKAVDRPDRSACVLCPPGGAEFVTFSVRGPNARSVAYACRALWLAAKTQVWKMAFR